MFQGGDEEMKLEGTQEAMLPEYLGAFEAVAQTPSGGEIGIE